MENIVFGILFLKITEISGLFFNNLANKIINKRPATDVVTASNRLAEAPSAAKAEG